MHFAHLFCELPLASAFADRNSMVVAGVCILKYNILVCKRFKPFGVRNALQDPLLNRKSGRRDAIVLKDRRREAFRRRCWSEHKGACAGVLSSVLVSVKTENPDVFVMQIPHAFVIFVDGVCRVVAIHRRKHSVT